MSAQAVAAMAWLERVREEMLEDLRQLVERDAPTGDAHVLAGMAGWLADWLAPLGRVELVPVPGGAPHLVVEIGPVGRGAPLVLCHYDTVWPAGTARRRPFRVDGDRASGPGVLDMKASLVIVRYAHRALRRLGVEPAGGVRLLVTADEERGNPTSEQLVLAQARRAGVALVMEPPLADGRLKTERKGLAQVRFELEGRAAHAGIEPERGLNAAVEAARIAVAADALAAPQAGTSVNVGVLRAGTHANVVPSSATVEIDVRAPTAAELDRVVDALHARDSRCAVRRRCYVRAPMPRLPSTDPLLAIARRVGAALGIAIEEGATGGVSEGNLTQSAGTPTLDGLGAVGAGAHAPHEHISVASLIERTALHAGMLVELSSDRRMAAPDRPDLA
jgi:glutamate carboxypeptidase